jgi:hypothetical protein
MFTFFLCNFDIFVKKIFYLELLLKRKNFALFYIILKDVYIFNRTLKVYFTK